MTLEKIKPTKVQTLKKDEEILVVKRNLILKTEWSGFRTEDFSEYLPLIEKHQEFLWRSEMENDPSYKQVIPYLIFTHDDKFFVMQRKSSASEQRLKNKFSVGIGGHINKKDIQNSNIFDWARREFNEEVSFSGDLEVTPIGIINDDSNEVGQVHIGFAFLLKGSTGKISVKSELKSGSLMSRDECKALLTRMEPWSSLVMNKLLAE